jgi:hypothetical protein
MTHGQNVPEAAIEKLASSVNHFTLGQLNSIHRLDGNMMASNKKLGRPHDALQSIDNGGRYIRRSRHRGKFRDSAEEIRSWCERHWDQDWQHHAL